MAKKISFLIIICIFISIIVSADNNNNLLGEVLEVKKVPKSISKEIIKVKILVGIIFSNKETITEVPRLV